MDVTVAWAVDVTVAWAVDVTVAWAVWDGVWVGIAVTLAEDVGDGVALGDGAISGVMNLRMAPIRSARAPTRAVGRFVQPHISEGKPGGAPMTWALSMASVGSVMAQQSITDVWRVSKAWVAGMSGQFAEPAVREMGVKARGGCDGSRPPGATERAVTGACTPGCAPGAVYQDFGSQPGPHMPSSAQMPSKPAACSQPQAASCP